MFDETEIQDKLSHAATLMSNRAPILLGFYIMLEKRMTSDKSVTMRVGCADGQPYLEYSDWFVNAMEPSLLGAVVYANCLRIALHHCDTRVKMPEAMFRLASDLVVYEYARNVVDTTVGDNSAIVGQLFPSIWAYADRFDAAGFDPVKDLTLEKVFDLLMQAQEESKNETEEENPDGEEDNGGQGDSDESEEGDEEGGSPNHEGESGGDGEDEEDGENQSGGGSNGESDDSDSEESEGEGSGEGQADGSGEGNGEKSEAYQAIQQMFDPNSAPADMKDWGNDSDASDNIRDAASAQFASGQGGMSGKVPLAIQEANRVHVNAEAVFRMFMASNFGTSTRQTWSMPNLVLRRYGTIAPGHVRKKDKPKILFAVDVSGSMLSMNLVNRCFETVNNFIGDAALDLCYWDGICSEIIHDPKTAFETDVFGGGMTNPQCVLDRLEKEHLVYDGIVYLTDCEFDWTRPRDIGKICIVKMGNGAGEVPAWCLWHMGLDDLLRNAA